MIKGTIIKGIGGFYYIDTCIGVYECRARGIFRKNKITPTVGDHVEISVLDEQNKKGSLDVISPRRNELIRPKVANVDQAIIVFAAKSPNINIDLLDRFIILAEEQELEVVICINKIDLDKKKEYESIIDLYKSIGYSCIGVSAAKGINVDLISELLKNKISVFAGPSGVGKSSIINSVAPCVHLVTGEISAKIERGKHTTRHAELIEIDDGSFIVDSPGFTSLYIDHIEQERLKDYFIEFNEYEGLCRYNGCSHTHEPGCAVKEAVGVGIYELRYNRYLNLYKELAKERRR